MLRISLFEFFVRGIPEEFLFVFAAHTFSKTRIDLKRYILSGTLFWALGYIIRFMPIEFGIHTILMITALIGLITYINKIDIFKSIRAAIFSFIIESACEGINVFIIQFILKKDLQTTLNNSISKTLYGIPSILLFGTFVIIYYLILSKRKELKQL